MENVLRPVTVVGTAVLVTLVVGWAVDTVLRTVDARHTETPLWGLLRRCRIPFQLVLCTALLRASYRAAHLAKDHTAAVGQILNLVLIGACAWLAVRVASALVDASYDRYASNANNAARVRRVRTQVTLIQRVVTAVVVVVAIASMLFTFPEMRAVGASVLASAGIIGIVAGVAAQSTLGNLFAGLQIAFGDMVRIGDTVVVDREWGTVEEITLTYLTVRTWDERRITMPVSYFTSKPFENWSRGDPMMTGTVFFHLDHSAPIDLMRERLHLVLKECEQWDRRAWGLVVIDTTPTTIQVRALVTAKDADDIFTLRCVVREQLLDWVRREHPYALPRINTAPAPGLDAEPPHPPAAPPTSDDIGPGPGAR
ncbi:mechanosensitive ion channel [Streptomyces sp. H10-C2]|uniref:mechanosensitive ion channel family protein n=1 Tax=unclassified Streptomyces TaxID=2593676 RepID=UPI0024BAE718|nr:MULTISPECIES: mechanosensitive ion channel domain-containing protein [unclassified Streptomyces]MDJ0341068.1 mechanosensitive ion channel [Streptomyces sp. PH10-H1]MDJ0369581.1 mechanosensitive ion channel [Streptomyces sp. H10-C2]